MIRDQDYYTMEELEQLHWFQDDDTGYCMVCGHPANHPDHYDEECQ